MWCRKVVVRGLVLVVLVGCLGAGVVYQQWTNPAAVRQQVVDMEKARLPSPSTVAGFLVRRELVPGAVVVVDEAGQIGGRQMLELLRLARE